MLFPYYAALQCGTASLTLRDQDQTNRRDGDWTRVNTLGHYNVDEMVRVVRFKCPVDDKATVV